MEENSKSPQIEQGLEYWENEVQYFEQALEGLKMSYAILNSMREHASKKVAECTPEREEVQ